jgi:hypothetical protein
MGGRIRTHERYEKYLNVLLETPDADRTLRRLGVNARIILKWLLHITEIGFGSMDLIHLTRDRDRRRVLVKTVLKQRVSYKTGIFWKAESSTAPKRALIHGVSYDHALSFQDIYIKRR